ncbi:Aldo/keto reductase [Gymnopus androsaceus JB14]|uniref:Aldo/keto reductase n=1 Tax=Gymnopus androsaceus JB14 TaxID=1447944 RepID=A0A6A4H8W1_9AGAR|nr:Aldo/keto reductase [Gymnopus androsaceus JB14]
MPWENVKLNSGYEMPSIAFGTWKLGNGEGPINQVDQAINVGFSHVDTAQMYMNEQEVGQAIHNSGLKRSEIFITTKFSGTDGLNIKTSIKNSLDYLGVTYVDLYLIHGPGLAVPDIPTAWKEMEDIQAQGLAKSIGVSNFDVNDLEILMASAKVPPAANQILLHPYYYVTHAPIIHYARKHNISIEAYSALTPLTESRGGPVDAPVNEIAQRLDVAPEQVLLAWVKAKGAVAVTTSSKKDRLQRYLAAGDLLLTDQDVAAIDAAGAIGRFEGFEGFEGLQLLMKTGAGDSL